MTNKSLRLSRSGFTILELLVTISAIGVLLALMIPAVQSARSSAQQLACRNNFRQIGTAVQQYVAAHGKFPRTRTSAGSSFVSLLPFLDEGELYAVVTGEKEQIRASMFHQPKVFVCPDDPVALNRRLAISAGENIGICAQDRGADGSARAYDGVILRMKDPGQSTPASIRDGMSNTAAYSEILGFPRPDRSRLIYTHATDGVQCAPIQAVGDWCRAGTIGMPSWSYHRGSSWMQGMVQVNQYMHVLPPNERECLFTPNSASMHRRGVHTAFCDGAVRFVSSTVDETVWRATGSRASSDGPVEW